MLLQGMIQPLAPSERPPNQETHHAHRAAVNAQLSHSNAHRAGADSRRATEASVLRAAARRKVAVASDLPAVVDHGRRATRAVVGRRAVVAAVSALRAVAVVVHTRAAVVAVVLRAAAVAVRKVAVAAVVRRVAAVADPRAAVVVDRVAAVAMATRAVVAAVPRAVARQPQRRHHAAPYARAARLSCRPR